VTGAAPNDKVREEFNRWAEEGRGEALEHEHLPIVLPVLDRMHLLPDDNVFDIGCGTGWLARKSMRQPVVTGAQGMIGARAEAIGSFSDNGTVQYGGEIWKARTQAPVSAGQSVRILKVEGLVLWVEPT